MATKLSQTARDMLEDAGCSEVTDEYLVLAVGNVKVLLSHEAVADLNKQARNMCDEAQIAKV